MSETLAQPAQTVGIGRRGTDLDPSHCQRRADELYAGLDLSRKRLDFRSLSLDEALLHCSPFHPSRRIWLFHNLFRIPSKLGRVQVNWC